MDLDVRDDGRVTIIAVEGDLVIGEPEAAFKKTANRLLEEGEAQILIACTDLRTVDSSGLGALVRALTTTRNEGGQTKLLGVGPRLLKRLELTALGSVFEIDTGRESAVGICAGAFGEGTARSLRRTAPRDEGVVHELVRDRATIAITREEIEAAADPFIRILPPSTKTCLVVPLEDGTQLVGIAALLFRGPFDPDRALDGLASLLLHSNPALGRFLRADRKAAGMLQAIERLTNLFDLTKAFGSTIDLEKLCWLIVTKAADFAGAEVASLWLLEGDAGEVALTATAANENYDVSPVPAAVRTGVVGDVIADRTPVRRNQLVEDDPIRAADAPFPVRSILALPFLEDESVTGALVVVNKRGRQAEFTLADEELLGDLVKQAVRALRNARLYEAENEAVSPVWGPRSSPASVTRLPPRPPRGTEERPALREGARGFAGRSREHRSNPRRGPRPRRAAEVPRDTPGRTSRAAEREWSERVTAWRRARV